MATDALVIADTHVGAGQVDRLLERIGDELADADVVLHAGDITDALLLDALAAHRLHRVTPDLANGQHRESTLTTGLYLNVHSTELVLAGRPW